MAGVVNLESDSSYSLPNRMCSPQKACRFGITADLSRGRPQTLENVWNSELSPESDGTRQRVMRVALGPIRLAIYQ